MLAHSMKRIRLPATVSAAGTFTSDADLTTYTSGAISIGTPGNRRHIAALVATNSGALRTGSSCTVDGEALSFIVGVSNTLTRLELWFGDVATANTTGVLEFVWSDATTRMAAQLLECHHIVSATATATDTDTTDNTALTAAVLGGGIAIGAAACNNTTTFGWTSLTDHGDLTADSQIAMAAASAAYGLGATASGTPDAATASQFCSVLATFR